jgi:4-amino-4-deoxy-L-arabinose transferase-like glycosyltransferase
VSEVLVTLWTVVTLLLFRRAQETGRRAPYLLSVLTFGAALLTHEGGFALLPLMVLMSCLLAPEGGARLPLRAWVPYGLIVLACGAIAIVVNARNPLVSEHHYEPGWHIARNIVQAVVSMAVSRRDFIWIGAVAAVLAWSATLAPRPIRFFALWIIIALLPFSLFRDDLASRYYYPAAVGFSAMAAEMISLGRTAIWRQGSLWRRALWVVAIFLVFRSAAFSTRNVHIWSDDRLPFEAYAAQVRELYPDAQLGATLRVPPPPVNVEEFYVEPLLRWTYRDPSLTAQIDK